MHTTNEKVFARSEKEESEFNHHSGCSRDAGCESIEPGNQQERISRADSSRSNFFGNGDSVSGGIIRQLIKDYVVQLAHKRDERKRIEEEKKRIDAEIVQLDSKIKEFDSLLQQLESNKET